MNLEVDSLGTPFKDFHALRDELMASGLKFDSESLAFIPYEQLATCATGAASTAMCSLAVIREEKECRRSRFLTMSDVELQGVQTLLQVEQMEIDVIRERACLRAPKWNEIRPRQQIWFKLNCICNHLDNVDDRIREAKEIFLDILRVHDLPDDVVRHEEKSLLAFRAAYPQHLSDSGFRREVAVIALRLKNFLPDEEQVVCNSEVLYQYSCTSDCYQPLV